MEVWPAASALCDLKGGLCLPAELLAQLKSARLGLCYVSVADGVELLVRIRPLGETHLWLTVDAFSKKVSGRVVLVRRGR
jgi:hypothetical protein